MDREEFSPTCDPDKNHLIETSWFSNSLQLIRSRLEMDYTKVSTIKTQVGILRITIGIIYLWFGALKFFAGVSPAEELAKNTIHLLTFGLINPDLSLLLLAIWETVVGLLLISGLFSRFAFWFVIVHMGCTFTPLILLPKASFNEAPFALTLVGQYIINKTIYTLTILQVKNV